MILEDELVLAWLVIAGASVAYVTWDNFGRGNPEAAVMRWGWGLVTLYMGPVGLALYVLGQETVAGRP